jgi:signal transduction histidine kinase
MKEVQRHAKDARRVVETSISHLEKETNVLRTVAATGGLMLAFVHEARALIGTLETYAGTLERLARSLNRRQQTEFFDLARNLRSAKTRFDTQVKLVTGISVDLSTTTRRKLLIKDVLKEIEDCFAGLLGRFNIKFEKRIPKDLRTGLMLESELYSILLNLLSNAIKVVIAAPGHRIRVEASQRRDGTVLRVYDDGIGLSRQQRETVFQPLVSDPEGRLYSRLEKRLEYSDLTIVGEGSGMGLSIIRDIVESYGKNIKFIDTRKPWVTCVEVTLP